MKPPVNLAVLHDMTDSDPELERKLFGDFLNSAEDCLAVMECSQEVGLEQAWQQKAHALKGMCLNLGAGHLAKLCKKAQDFSTATPEEKSELFKAIRSEFENVKWYLERHAH